MTVRSGRAPSPGSLRARSILRPRKSRAGESAPCPPAPSTPRAPRGSPSSPATRRAAGGRLLGDHRVSPSSPATRRAATPALLTPPGKSWLWRRARGGGSSDPCTPGGVELAMPPGLALCEAGSQESSAGGFRRAELARREVRWIPLRWACITQAGPGLRRFDSRWSRVGGALRIAGTSSFSPPGPSSTSRPRPYRYQSLFSPSGPSTPVRIPGTSFSVVAIPAGPSASRGSAGP